MPGGQRALVVEAGFGLDESGGTEVGPGELLLAGPAQRDGLAGRLREARGLLGGFARVLAAKAAAKIRDNHAHVVVRQMKGAHEVRAVAERVLCAGPDGQLAVGPFGNGGAGFQRGVLDVGDMIGLAQRVFGFRQLIGEGTRRRVVVRVLLEVVEQVLARRMGRQLPLGRLGNGRPRLLGEEGGRRGDSDKLAVLHGNDILHRFGRAQINRGEFRAVGGRAEDFAVEHSGPDDVRGILVRAGDYVASVRAGCGIAEHLPLLDWGQGDIGGDRLLEGFARRRRWPRGRHT